jgi:hypothetical protein
LEAYEKIAYLIGVFREFDHICVKAAAVENIAKFVRQPGVTTPGPGCRITTQRIWKFQLTISRVK